MVLMMVGSALITAVGQIRAGQAADQMGKAQQQGLEHQAEQMRVNAGQERAASQRDMIIKRKQATLVQSRAQAVAAASGGGTLDASIVDIMGDLEAEGDYGVNLAQYHGEERARDLESGAQMKVFEGGLARTAGKNAKKASRLAAVSTVIKAGASAMGGMGGAENMGASSTTSGMSSGQAIQSSGIRPTARPSYR